MADAHAGSAKPHLRWKPEFGLTGREDSRLGSCLPGDWNAELDREETEVPDPISEEFRGLVTRLVNLHSQELAEVRLENAELKAKLQDHVSKSEILHSGPESSAHLTVLQTEKRPAGDFNGQQSDGLVSKTAKSLGEKISAGVAQKEEEAALSVMDRLRQFLQSTLFDAIISCVLFANVMFLAFQLQMEGSRTGYDIDYYAAKNPNDSVWSSITEALKIIDYIFTVIFSLDVSVRVVCLKIAFWKSTMNWIDFTVVTLTIGSMVLDTSSLPLDPIFLRLLRLGKLARAFRMIILSGKLESFGLLLKCVLASVTMLGYATCVLFFVQCICGMIISTLVARYLEDPEIDKESRRHVFQYWGTFTRTFLTMFEVLFANWAPACRSLTDYVSEWFIVVFVGYRCVVGFALLNVVNSVFVSQTLKIADSDEEYLIKVRQRDEAQYRKKLHALFMAADTTDDGFLTIEEFMQLLENQQMKLWLSQLQLEYHDLVELFGMIDTGDGRIDWKEFMDGAIRLKGQAKSLDVFRLETKVDSIVKSVANLATPTTPGAQRLLVE